MDPRAALRLDGRVRLEPDFFERVERLAARERRRSTRLDAEAGLRSGAAGQEFLGYRPYAAGEDARDLDWNLLARFDAPYVRVRRGERSSTLWIGLDASRSMAVGRRSKLQAACELAFALSWMAWRERTRVQLATSWPGGSGSLELEGQSVRDAARWRGALEDLDALSTRADWSSLELCQRLSARAARVVWIGDLMDLEPEQLAARLLPLAARGARIEVWQVLAPEEWNPPRGAPTTWIDPESGARAREGGSSAEAERYHRHLLADRARWRRALERLGGVLRAVSSADSLEAMLEGARGPHAR